MDGLQLFAIETDGIRPLPIPPSATGFDDMYDNFTLGVYSVLRTFEHNKFLYLQAHIARTIQSMQLLGWDYQLDEQRLRHALHDACTAYPFPDARVRFDVLAEPPAQLDSRLLLGLMPFAPVPASYYQNGVRVDVAPDLHRNNPLAKTAVFAQTRRQYPPNPDVYEYLLVDAEGYLLEGTGSNFYGVRAGVLYTAGTGVLEGITRQIILQQAAALGIPVILQAIHKDEIATLDEAALSSSSRALLPIVAIGTQVVGNGRPGPICQQILTAYNSFVARTIETAI
jgi:branched-chain amino acid aminotransferase